MEGIEVLREGVRGLLECDVAGMGDGEIGEVLVELHRLRAQLGAVVLGLTSVFDRRRAYGVDGSKSAGAWLARECNTAKVAAGRQVRLARRLRAMPITAGALGAGEIDELHAGVLARAADSPRPAVAAAFPDAEADLVGFAKDLDFAGFVRAVKYWEDTVDEDGAEDQPQSDRAARRLHVSETFRGNFRLDGQLDVLGGTAFATALRRIDRELFLSDWDAAKQVHGAATTVGDLGRTPAQRRADALVEMARRAMAMPRHARKPRPLINVMVGYETFAGRTCEMFNRLPVTPGQVASLLTETEIERVVFDGPNRIIELGVRERFFTGGLRRVIEIRDRHCTAPGCDTPPTNAKPTTSTPTPTAGQPNRATARTTAATTTATKAPTPTPPATPDGWAAGTRIVWTIVASSSTAVASSSPNIFGDRSAPGTKLKRDTLGGRRGGVITRAVAASLLATAVALSADRSSSLRVREGGG